MFAACLLLCWRGVVSRIRSLVVLGVLLLASLAISVAVQVEIEVLRSSTAAFFIPSRLTFSCTCSDSLLVAQIAWRFFGGLSVAVPSCGQQRLKQQQKHKDFFHHRPWFPRPLSCLLVCLYSLVVLSFLGPSCAPIH